MLIDEQRECGNLPINTTVNYNSANNGEKVLTHNIIRAVIYKVCPDPARRQQCITAPTVSHNTVITAVITACDLHACSACVHVWKHPNCLWEDCNILLSSHFDRCAEGDSDTTSSVAEQQNNRISENRLHLQLMCWRNYSCFGFPPAAPPLLPPQRFDNALWLVFPFDDGEIWGSFKSHLSHI